MTDVDRRVAFAARWLGPILEQCAAHPRLVRTATLGFAKGALGRRLTVAMRGLLGATAFEAHDVDVASGRIALGGVDEVIFSSRFLEFFHQEFAAEAGAEAAARVLYRIGRRGGRWEVSEALRQGRWAPRSIAELIASGRLLEAARHDAQVARLFDVVMNLALRMIINEGGWGVATFEMARSPILVTLRNSQEAQWLGPAGKPVCHIAAGVIAGYTTEICRSELDAREIVCAAAGGTECLFELGAAVEA